MPWCTVWKTAVVVWGLLMLPLLLLPLLPLSPWRLRRWMSTLVYPRRQWIELGLAWLFVFSLWLVFCGWTDNTGPGWAMAVLFLTMGIGVGIGLRDLLPYTQFYPKEVDDFSGEPWLSVCIANVKMENNRREALWKVVLEQDADLIVLLEPGTDWTDVLEAHNAAYPHRHLHLLDNAYGMAVISKTEIEDFAFGELVQDNIPSAWGQLRLGDRPFGLCVLHPKPPAPDEAESKWPLVREWAGAIDAFAQKGWGADMPFLVAGDFNDVPWSRAMRLFRQHAGLLDPGVGRHPLATFHAKYRWLRWPLDQVLLSSHFACMRRHRFSLPGSDHFGLLMHIGWCGPKEKAS